MAIDHNKTTLTSNLKTLHNRYGLGADVAFDRSTRHQKRRQEEYDFLSTHQKYETPNRHYMGFAQDN